jgi:oligoribonuclease
MPWSVSRNNITVAAGLAGVCIAADGNAFAYPSAVLVWMDLEMTGLDPARHVIVEIATLVTDDDLNIIAEGPDLVVHHDEAALAEMDPVVVEMHTRSGLLELIRASTMTLADAGAQTLEFIKAHVSEPRRVPLCGNSIGMDRRFLAAYLPEIEEYLHYRSVDVSTVKELVKRWYPVLNSSRPRKAGAHRALDDVMESVAEMKFYREHVFVHEIAATAVAPEPPTDEVGAMESSPESS